MIRLALYSHDTKLQPLLASALKPEYTVAVESSQENIKRMVADHEADVLILDFDSNYSSLEEQLAFYDEVGDCHIPIVVMSDDVTRSTAIELMQRGAYDYIRKPPSLIELKIVVRRAHEHTVLRGEIKRIREDMRSASGCDQLAISWSAPAAARKWSMMI